MHLETTLCAGRPLPYSTVCWFQRPIEGLAVCGQFSCHKKCWLGVILNRKKVCPVWSKRTDGVINILPLRWREQWPRPKLLMRSFHYFYCQSGQEIKEEIVFLLFLIWFNIMKGMLFQLNWKKCLSRYISIKAAKMFHYEFDDDGI